MTLVLLWRVPARRVGLRWRGPAGLLPAIEREPLTPVTAVIGPPGIGGAVSFPPMPIMADAATPVPAAGVGSVAWSTVMAGPVIWDGLRWRSFAFFCVPPDVVPDWVPAGALAVSDFAEGRYWRADIGVCGIADLWTADPVSWYPYDPATAVVPGVGLTTGEVSSISGNTVVGPVSTPELWALIETAGGCSAYGEYEQTASVPYGDNDSHGFTVGLCYEFPGYSVEMGSFVSARVSAGIPADKTRHIATAWPGGDYANTQTQIALPAKIANSMDFATGKTLCSADGTSVPGKTGPGDYSALNAFVCEVSLTNAHGDKTMRVSCARHVVYPPMNQAALDALTALPGAFIDFTAGSLPSAATLTRASSGTHYDSDGLMQLASANEARFDHDPLTGALRGLLIEPAATNLLTKSQGFANDGLPWQAVGGASVTLNDAAAPDGTTTADRLTFANVGDHARLQIGGWLEGITANADYALSLHARQPDSGAATHTRLTTLNAFAWDSGLSGKYALSPAWQRLALTGPLINDGTTLRPVFGTTTASAAQDPDCLGNALLWGAQLEAGSVATSYIPTAGSTATRAEDRVTIEVPAGKTVARCTLLGGTVDLPVSEGPRVLTAADFGGVPVWLQGIAFS